MSTVRLMGTLARDARHFVTTDGQAFLEVCIGQEGYGTAAVARRRMGQGSAAQYVCATDSRRFKRGKRVTVHAAGYEIDRLRGELVLVGVDHIELHDIPVDHFNPERAEHS